MLLPDDAIGRAEQAGVLSTQEAFALEALSDTEHRVPEELFDAVERLFLWLVPADPTIN